MQDVRQTGLLKRVPAIRRSTAVLLAVWVLAAVAGCGGKDESEAMGQAGQRSLVPATPDSAVVDSLAAGSGSASLAGTSPAPRVLSSVASDQTMPHAETLKGSADAEPAVSRPLRRPQVPARSGAFSLQLGSFRSAYNARARAERISGLGYAPAIEVASLAGQTYHRVVLHGLPDRDEAERQGEKIRSQLGITYLIRRK